MSEELSFLLADISSYAGIVPSLIALLRFKHLTLVQRHLAILVWGGTGVAGLAYLFSLFNWNNLSLLHIYTIFNFIMMSIVFRTVIPRKLFYPLLVAFCAFALFNSIWVDQLQTLNVVNRSVSAFIIMFYALTFFLKTLKDMQVQRLELMPLFWISIGALFYNAGSFFIFLFSKDITPFEELWLTYFGIHSAFTVLLYIFYTIALWVRPKTSTV